MQQRCDKIPIITHSYHSHFHIARFAFLLAHINEYKHIDAEKYSFGWLIILSPE